MSLKLFEVEGSDASCRLTTDHLLAVLNGRKTNDVAYQTVVDDMQYRKERLHMPRRPFDDHHRTYW